MLLQLLSRIRMAIVRNRRWVKFWDLRLEGIEHSVGRIWDHRVSKDIYPSKQMKHRDQMMDCISQLEQIINFAGLHLYPIQPPGLGRATTVQCRCRCRSRVREAIWSQQVR